MGRGIGLAGGWGDAGRFQRGVGVEGFEEGDCDVEEVFELVVFLVVGVAVGVEGVDAGPVGCPFVFLLWIFLA